MWPIIVEAIELFKRANEDKGYLFSVEQRVPHDIFRITVRLGVEYQSIDIPSPYLTVDGNPIDSDYIFNLLEWCKDQLNDYRHPWG